MSKLLRNSIVIAGTPDTSTEIRHIPTDGRNAATTVGAELANIQNKFANNYDSTATYAEGDIFNYNGNLAKAILDIDAGDPLVEHTNFEYTNISNLLEMRYNSTTDMIQVKVNGSWVDTPYKAYGTFDGTLYNAGVQAVPWDNTGYPASTDTESAGYEGAVLSSDSFTFNVAAVGGINGILTNDKIDCSGFTSLKATIGGTTYTLNISQYTSEPAYIVIYEYANGQDWGLYMTLASTKQYYNNTDNRITGTHWEDLPTATRSTSIPSITKVWLE